MGEGGMGEGGMGGEEVSDFNLESKLKELSEKVRVLAQFIAIKPTLEEQVEVSWVGEVLREREEEKRRVKEEMSKLEKKREEMMKNTIGALPIELEETEKLKEELSELTKEEKVLLEKLESVRKRQNEVKEKLALQLRYIVEYQKGQSQVSQLTEGYAELGIQIAELKQKLDEKSVCILHFNNLFYHSLPQAIHRSNLLLEKLSSKQLYTQCSLSALSTLQYFHNVFSEMALQFPKAESRARKLLKASFDRLKLRYQQMKGCVQAILHPSFLIDDNIRNQLTFLKDWIENFQLRKGIVNNN